MCRLHWFAIALCALVCMAGLSGPLRAGKPNIVVILSDDQGFADVSYNGHHPAEVETPNIDRLARASVMCTQGYTTGHVCSPTRAGLMTGRYQQRFGIYTAGEGGSGVPLGEVFLPQYLKPAGYVCGALGKWHMGLTMEYNAVNRGFDEFYGFMGRGAHDYFDLNIVDHPIYRGTTPIQDKGYLTTRITEEAVDFITRHKTQPFFLYVAYNAVHAPAEAPEADIQHRTGDKTRDILMAMNKHLDLGVGRIVKTLSAAGLFENTLLIYLTDNGGAKAMHANNAPLRGFKQQDYEGGIRVPFVVSWPARLRGGSTCDVPVLSIDIVPTVLAAAGIDLPPRRIIDGRNMLPVLEGSTKPLHTTMYWSSGGNDGKWAVRSGDWKLVAVKDSLELFNLRDDIGESSNLAPKYPAKVAELTRRYNQWLDEMAEPTSGQPKRWSADLKVMSKAERRKQRDARRSGRRGTRKIQNQRGTRHDGPT